MIIYPEYYTHFKCIASECQHSCCKGWEIDVDNDSLKKYAHVSGEFGEKLRHSIYIDDEGAHFALDEDERCPFLQEDGLCEMILRIGEDKLCQICSDHPRFRNFLSTRTEVGLGLCCESSASLILKWQGCFKLVGETDETSSDKEFLAARETLLAILTDRTRCIDERFDACKKALSADLPAMGFNAWVEEYKHFEILDSSWLNLLENAKLIPTDIYTETPEIELALEQLAVYFIYRHLSGALEDDLLVARALFALHATEFIRSLWKCNTNKSLEEFIEIARLYSSEIEYSDENIYLILEILSR